MMFFSILYILVIILAKFKTNLEIFWSKKKRNLQILSNLDRFLHKIKDFARWKGRFFVVFYKFCHLNKTFSVNLIVDKNWVLTDHTIIFNFVEERKQNGFQTIEINDLKVTRNYYERSNFVSFIKNHQATRF